MSIYTECVKAGLEVGNWESDLHVLASPEAFEIIDRHQKASDVPVHVTGFRSDIDGRQWVEILFAYDPAWEARTS